MHSYCLFLCWRASEITTHHEPVHLCLRRGADAVPVSGAHGPFAWKMGVKGVVQVWKSLAWKINKLKLALASEPHALWGAAPVLLVLISVTISSYSLPVLFQRNSQNVRTRVEPSQVPAPQEAGSGGPAGGSQPLLCSWSKKYHRPSSWPVVCTKHAVVRCVTRCIMALQSLLQFRYLRLGWKWELGGWFPISCNKAGAANKINFPRAPRCSTGVTTSARLAEQAACGHSLLWSQRSQWQAAPHLQALLWQQNRQQQEKSCAHQNQIQPGASSRTTVWEGEGSRFQPI